MLRQFFFGVAIFISSGCGLIIEIVAGRIIAPYVGMSLYTWTAIIAVVLAGLSAGHWYGGQLAGCNVDAEKGGRRVAIALGLASISSLASLILLRIVASQLKSLEFGAITSIILLALSLFFLPSFFVGIVSPILTKLALDGNQNRQGAIIGRMFALGALGSIAGTLSAGYLFISWIGSTGTIVTVAIIYALLGLCFAINDSLRGLFLFSLISLIGGLVFWGQRINAFHSPCDLESDYFCIRVADYSHESGRPSSLLALDHLVHSINDRDNPSFLYSPYIHGIDEIMKNQYFKETRNFSPRAFFIGGGGYSLPRAWANDYMSPELIVAEIDPEVTKIAKKSMWLNIDSSSMQIFHRDARALLQSLPTGKTFDFIFGDAFHDISIPPHLVTREFHQQVLKRLSSKGVYTINVVDSGVKPLFLFSLIKTLNKDFSSVEVWIDQSQKNIPDRITYIVFSSNEPSSVSNLRSLRGPNRYWIKWPAQNLSHRILKASPPILTDDFSPVDRLMSNSLQKYSF